MTFLERVISRGLKPNSYCAGCARPWFSTKRRVCRCGASGRIFVRTTTDAIASIERAVGRKEH